MNEYQKTLDKIRKILGSYAAIGAVCGISGRAVKKWHAAGHPPRTEYTGETNYAEAILKAIDYVITKPPLLPKIDKHD